MKVSRVNIYILSISAGRSFLRALSPLRVLLSRGWQSDALRTLPAGAIALYRGRQEGVRETQEQNSGVALGCCPSSYGWLCWFKLDPKIIKCSWICQSDRDELPLGILLLLWGYFQSSEWCPGTPPFTMLMDTANCRYIGCMVNHCGWVHRQPIADEHFAFLWVLLLVISLVACGLDNEIDC